MLHERGGRRWFFNKAEQLSAFTVTSGALRAGNIPVKTVLRALAPFSTLRPAILASPDGPRFPNPEPGTVARHADQDKYYYIKQEIGPGGKERKVGYLIQYYNDWKRNVGFIGIETQMDAFNVNYPERIPEPEKITLAEAPGEKRTVDFWDGSKKNYNENGGLKFVLIPGLFSNSRDLSSFDELTNTIKELGYNDGDILPMPYNIGFHHDKEDTMRDPEESLKNMSILIDRWKKEHPLDKFWLIGHSQGGYLAHNLAIKHKDAVAGVISINGAIKGATISEYIPQPIEAAIQELLYGSVAGKFHLERAGNPQVSFKVEQEVNALKKLGIIYVSFSDIDDPITKTVDSHVVSSTGRVDGEQVVQTLKSPPWLGWKDLDFLPEWLTRDAKEYIGHHWAPLFDPLVKYYFKKVLIPPKPGHEEQLTEDEEFVDVVSDGINPDQQEFGVTYLDLNTQQPVTYLNQIIKLGFNAAIDKNSWMFDFFPPLTQPPHVNFLHKQPDSTEIQFVPITPWENFTKYNLIIKPNFTTRGKAVKKGFSLKFTTNTYPYKGI